MLAGRRRGRGHGGSHGPLQEWERIIQVSFGLVVVRRRCGTNPGGPDGGSGHGGDESSGSVHYCECVVLWK